MSTYVTYDASPGEQVASVTGWGDFVRWASALSELKYPNLVQLAEWGSTEPVDALLFQLQEAERVEGIPDVPGLQTTVNEFEELLKGYPGGVPVFITDGMSPADSEGGEE